MTERPPAPISPTDDIVADLRAGRMVILVDEEDRENEGDLVLAADHVTPEAINFMARFGRGLICLTLTRERCEYLRLPPMAARNGTVYSTAFTVSIEAAEGVTTGISAADRARTVQVAVATGSPGPTTWCSPAMSSRCRRWMAACSCAPATPKPAATWPPWPAARPPP
jgi:3,4-dihydroxy 2-butanone 4-phosphate synthase/GTP cyclohydrolase II